MPGLKRLLLLVAVSSMALAVAPVGASAQETGVTVVDEATGEPCGPCVMHAVGESHFVRTTTGMLALSCQDEFNVRLYSDGSGEIEWMGSHDGFPGCFHSSCVDPGASHWSIMSSAGGAGAIGELGDGTAHMNFRFCVVTGSSLMYQCDIEATIAATGTPHQYALGATQICPGSIRYEMDALVESEDIELVHSD